MKKNSVSLPEFLKHPSVFLALMVLIFYQITLIYNAYRSQDQLRTAADAKYVSESKQVANLISHFFYEQSRFVNNASRSQEVENFLANKALGMSMQYGLSISLDAVEESFKKKLSLSDSFGLPTYRRIIFLEESGRVVVDIHSQEKDKLPVVDQSYPDGITIDTRQGLIVAQSRVEYRGVPQGKVITFTDLSVLTYFFNTRAQEIVTSQIYLQFNAKDILLMTYGDMDVQVNPILLSLNKNVPLPLSEVVHSSRIEVTRDEFTVLKTDITDTPFSIVFLVPTATLYSQITSNVYLFLSGIFPVLLFISLLIFFKLRLRTRQLEADVIETTKSKDVLSGKNDLLKEEIARRVALTEDLRKSEERYRNYIEHAPEGILVLDRLGMIIDVNPSLCNMTGYLRKELIGQSVKVLVTPAEPEYLYNLITRGKDLDAGSDELVFHKPDNKQSIVNMRFITLPNDMVMCFCLDITQQKQDEEKIHHLAYYDALTSLPNRRLLNDRLRQAIVLSSRTKEYGVLMILDLDHFKNLNDTMGHDVGDQLLVMVAARIKACMRENDVVARFGGDEFVILAEHLGTDPLVAVHEAEKIANKLLRDLNNPYSLEKAKSGYHISSSFGLSLFVGQTDGVETLLKQADLALYQAKNAGRNVFRFFNPQMQATINESTAMEGALRRAIENKELQLYCQPQVDENENAVGGEVLMRWLPPDSVPVTPDRFIALAERSGLILEIGEWLLGQALEQLKIWQLKDMTRSLTLSINVSAKQFHQPNFVEIVTAHLKKHEVNPEHLKLELTESSVLERVDEAIDRMSRLKKLGVRFSLDDFGTGYSSLSYLKLLPLDQVKIDQSFVRDIGIDSDDGAIIRAIIAMSQSLGLEVIAEGVESYEQRDFLLKYGCKLYQGYLFGRPVPIETFLAA